jgi:integrase
MPLSFVGFELEDKMPKMITNRLTATGVTKLKKPGGYCDGANLWLQITKTGVKSWLFRYMVAGVAKSTGLGPLHTISLAEARDKALQCRKMLLDGIDPVEHKRAQQTERKIAAAVAMTFDQCAKDYIAIHRHGWKSEKHAEQWASTLNAYASPIFGSLPVSKIDTDLVMKVLLPIWTTRTETASRLRGRIEKVLGWAATSKFRTGDNPARWKGHLENLLPAANKVKSVRNHPSLPFSRMYELLTEIQKQEGAGPAALEFQIYCAARPGEVRFARWSEIDLTAKVWHIPAERMKAEKPHEIPLCRAALELLKKLPKFDDCEFVFTADGKKPISENTANEVIKRMNGEAPTWIDPRQGNAPAVAHGFRSSFRDWAGETTSFPREVIEHALAHQLKDKAEAAYARGTLFEKRRALMDSWATFCNTKPKQATVTTIKAKVTA